MQADCLKQNREMERAAYEQQTKAFNKYKECEQAIIAEAASPVMLLPACQTRLTNSQPSPKPMLTLESSIPLPKETYSKRAAEDIVSW